MIKKRFKVIEAVKSGYLFTAQEWKYLLKIGMVPMILHIAIALFIQFYRKDASVIEGYLWGLPATALFSWFTFVEIRLLLLGERIGQSAGDITHIVNRYKLMKTTIIISLLFNMSITFATTTLMAITQSEMWGVDIPLTLSGSFIIGALFWGIRLGLLPILAAVGYPIKPFLQKMTSPLFSIQLMAMGILCLLPIALLFQLIVSTIIEQPEIITPEFQLSVKEQVLLIIISAPLSLITNILLNASAAFALKQMLKGDKK